MNLIKPFHICPRCGELPLMSLVDDPKHWECRCYNEDGQICCEAKHQDFWACHELWWTEALKSNTQDSSGIENNSKE